MVKKKRTPDDFSHTMKKATGPIHDSTCTVQSVERDDDAALFFHSPPRESKFMKSQRKMSVVVPRPVNADMGKTFSLQNTTKKETGIPSNSAMCRIRLTKERRREGFFRRVI